MTYFTAHNDCRIDSVISDDLELIVTSVTAAFPVRSIILGGGFGRGEGSVLVDGKKIFPVNDYDIFLIVPDDFVTDLRFLGKNLAQKINIRQVDLIPLKYSTLATLPALQIYYDLKYGGRLLWGEDVFARIPCYRQGFIEPESVRTLLLNRLVCAIEAFSEDFEKRPMTTSEAFFLVTQTGKVVSGCVESLLMTKKAYHHSCQERQKIFRREFPEKKEICWLNERATEFRMRPSETVDFDPVIYWKRAMKVYLDIISTYLVPPAARSKNTRELWRILETSDSEATITNNPVERIELMLLLYREAPFFSKRAILSQGYKEFNRITKTPLKNSGWEQLRERAACLWHELYH